MTVHGLSPPHCVQEIVLLGTLSYPAALVPQAGQKRAPSGSLLPH